MNTPRDLPAGLLNNDVEFFYDPENTEHAYYLTCGGPPVRIGDAVDWIKETIAIDMAKHPVKVEALVEIGYVGGDEQKEKYISCISGVFDGKADIIDGVIQHSEFVPCPKRGGACHVEGRLCNSLIVGPEDKALTRREIETLVLISKGLQNKEIADRMDISEETAKVFTKHLFIKSGLNNRAELVLLANQKNLIP